MPRPTGIPMVAIAALTLVGPATTAAQEASIPIHAAVELAVGMPVVGGDGVSGKAAFRVHRGGWGISLRGRGWNGERRELRPCHWFCSAHESFGERALLVERVVTPSPRVTLFFGAGPGRLSGRRFDGPTADLVAVSESVFVFELSSHLSMTRVLRLTPAIVGHVGPDGPVAALTLGLALGN